MARDRYKYFRIEARELIASLTQGVLDLEKGHALAELIGPLLRHAHTLKGSARVVGHVGIAERAHLLEDLLIPYREGTTRPGRDHVDQLLRLLDAITGEVATLSEPAQSAEVPSESPPARPVEDAFETVRIELGAMDALLNGLTEANVQVDGLKRHIHALERLSQQAGQLADDLASSQVRGGASGLASHLEKALFDLERDLSHGLDRLGHEVQDSLDLGSQLRLVPTSLMFTQLERTARDAAESLGKRINFVATGQEVRLDAQVLHGVRDALAHVVRNAAVHGIEPAGDRMLKQKPSAGTIRVRVERRDTRIAFVCEDDGRGIDLDRLRQVAVERGLLSLTEAAALDHAAALNLVFAAGVSTSSGSNQLSGRGVGLDVVQAVAARLRGEVTVRSERGLGTVVELVVPPTLSSTAALRLMDGRTQALLPLEGVRKALRVADADIHRTSDGATVISDGEVLPFVPLAGLLADGGATRHEAWSVVVVRAAAGSVALGTERLLGVTEAVVRPLPAMLGPVSFVTGLAFDAEGTPQPVLDPSAVVAARQRDQTPVTPVTPVTPDLPPGLPLLVVDDSLTTRMLEQSILEAAGFQVELATSAEEALELMQHRRYGLFVVDVEMPGMDGFGFVAHLRSLEDLRSVPAILVTSRGAAQDRRRGEEVGAQAYILKGEFDQGRFLQTVRDLLALSHG